jgi:hypothetical protein
VIGITVLYTPSSWIIEAQLRTAHLSEILCYRGTIKFGKVLQFVRSLTTYKLSQEYGHIFQSIKFAKWKTGIHYYTNKQVCVVVTVETYIWEVLCFNVCCNTGCPDVFYVFCQFLQINTEMLPWLCHDCLLPNPLQFTSHSAVQYEVV